MGILCRGKDFRTSFEKIGSLRAFTDVPIMALTASAPADIQATIINSLHLENPVFVRGDVDRPNIFLSVSGIKSLSVSFGVNLVFLIIINHN